MSEAKELKNKIRRKGKYKSWLRTIRERDKFTCQICGNPSREVHHLKSYSGLLQRYKVRSVFTANNCTALWDPAIGVVLCSKCHTSAHTKLKIKSVPISNEKEIKRLKDWLGNLLGHHEKFSTLSDRQQSWFEIHKRRWRTRQAAKIRYKLRKWLLTIQIQHKLQSFKQRKNI